MDPQLDLEIATVSAVIEAIRTCQGQPLHFSALGRKLGISRYRLWRCIAVLESKGMLYTLPAWCPPPLRPGKRVVRSSMVYVRDHQCLEPQELLLDCASCSPAAEMSYRSRMIEQIILRERSRSPETRFGHYSTPTMTRAALVVVTPLITVGFQFPLHPCPSKRCWTGLCKSIREGWVDRGLVVYPGNGIFFGSRWVVAVPAAGFLAGYRGWMEALERGTLEALRAHVRGCSSRLPVAGPTGSPA